MRKPATKMPARQGNLPRQAAARKTRIGGAEFLLKAEGKLLPKFSAAEGKFDKSKKIRALVVELAEPGKKKPIAASFLTANPGAEKRFGLSAMLKGRKRAWISLDNAPAGYISGKYGRAAFDRVMAAVVDHARIAAKQRGIEVLLVWAGTRYGEEMALRRGYKRIKGTPVLVEEL